MRTIWSLAAAVALLLGLVASSQATHRPSDTAGHTTLEQIVTGGRTSSSDPYKNLSLQTVNRDYVVRDATSEGDPSFPTAQSGREQRRRSLTYLGQLTDFQLADEESPARVEFVDQGADSAWRPQEALQPFIIDWSIRQMNIFAPASPVPQAGGARAPMDFALITGDQADSQQRNETRWTRELLEGGTTLNFNSGSTDPADYNPTNHPSCATLNPPTAATKAEARRYTGVQDYDDYNEGSNPYFYDPDDVRASWATAQWPTYTGLMDRAQQLSITPEGLGVPSYVTNGNHDTLVQGNENAVQAFETIATGCEKSLGSGSMTVPPDPERRYVSKPQVKAVYGENDVDNDHGFGFVSPAENAASNGSASYYAWNPPETPGFRFISLDTVSEGGVTPESASGNVDDPQFQWLRDELQKGTDQGKLIVIFGHHPVRSLTADVTDETAGACTGPQHNHGDTPEHDQNPGCDLDPRASTPIHLGRDPVAGDPRESFVELIDGFPNVIAYVSGHTHDNNVEPFKRNGGRGVWWGIETSATADWPTQHRLIEVMDNRDRTLSIFGTILDHAADAVPPPAGSAAGFTGKQLASLGREFAYNDPQKGAGTGEGDQNDQNVELLVRDPLKTDVAIQKSDAPDPVVAGSQLTYTLSVENAGASTATGVKVVDNLPASVVPISVTTTRGECNRVNHKVTCFLGDMGLGATATVTIKVIPQDDGVISNTATVSSIREDEGPSNNTSTTTTTVSSPPCPATATHTGTNGGDTLTGTNNSDRMRGLGGDDRIRGLLGNDCLFGDAGSDVLRGDAGRDRLDGGADNDFLGGGSGTDTFFGGTGNDRIYARDGFAETVNCGAGTDTVTADATDTLIDCESATPF
jgi:uncharacterized repeat protein (TIGR01451 family)